MMVGSSRTTSSVLCVRRFVPEGVPGDGQVSRPGQTALTAGTHLAHQPADGRNVTVCDAYDGIAPAESLEASGRRKPNDVGLAHDGRKA